MSDSTGYTTQSKALLHCQWLLSLALCIDLHLSKAEDKQVEM